MALSVSLGGIGQAFESRNFKIFWWGQLNLGVGHWVYRLALAWLTWELTQSTFWLGVVAAANMLPVLVLCPIGGVTADRWGHLRQLVLASAAMGVTGLVLVVMAVSGTLTIEWAVVWSLISGMTRAFTIPPRQALVPQIVEPRLLAAALGFQSATYYGANFVGPAIGGFLIATLGVGAALGYFVLGAIIATVALPFLKVPPRAGRPGKPPSFLADLTEGVRYTARHPGIRLMILMVALIALCVQPVVDMLASVADRVLVMGPGGLAILTTSFGCGAMVGGLWIAWRGRTDGLIRILLVWVIVGLAALGLCALSRYVWLSTAMLFLVGFAVVITNVAASSLIQNTVEPRLRARVMALDSMLSVGGPALGALIIGWAGAHFGIQPPLFVAAVFGLLVLALMQRRVRDETGRLEASPRPAE
jgi:MFS family permease